MAARKRKFTFKIMHVNGKDVVFKCQLERDQDDGYYEDHVRVKIYKEAALETAIKEGASLAYADLSWINLKNMRITSMDFTGASLHSVNFQDCELYSCDFSNATIVSSFNNTKVFNTSFNKSRLSGYFNESSLQNCNIIFLQEGSRIEAKATEFNDCEIRSLDFRIFSIDGCTHNRGYNRCDIIFGPTRSDGYQFAGVVDEQGRDIIKAGCRFFTVPEARKHWRKTRGGTFLGEESLAIVNFIQAMRKIKKNTNFEG